MASLLTIKERKARWKELEKLITTYNKRHRSDSFRLSLPNKVRSSGIPRDNDLCGPPGRHIRMTTPPLLPTPLSRSSSSRESCEFSTRTRAIFYSRNASPSTVRRRARKSSKSSWKSSDSATKIRPATPSITCTPIRKVSQNRHSDSRKRRNQIPPSFVFFFVEERLIGDSECPLTFHIFYSEKDSSDLRLVLRKQPVLTTAQKRQSLVPAPPASTTPQARKSREWQRPKDEGKVNTAEDLRRKFRR